MAEDTAACRRVLVVLHRMVPLEESFLSFHRMDPVHRGDMVLRAPSYAGGGGAVRADDESVVAVDNFPDHQDIRTVEVHRIHVPLEMVRETQVQAPY